MKSLSELLRRKNAAEERLNDPVLIEAFAKLREKALDSIVRSQPHEIEERETAYLKVRLLKDLESELRVMISDYDAEYARTERSANRA